MKKLLLENPDELWVELDNGVYTTPVFVEGAPNPLFNSLPNSPYLTNGQDLQYMGFLEGNCGTTTFKSEVLFVIVTGTCTVNNHIKMTARNALFSKEITCEQGAIVLVFMPKNINEWLHPLVETTEIITKTPYATKFRVYGQKLGDNIFFPAWSGLNYTFHSFTQISKKDVARGAHARAFFRKCLFMHKGKILMKTYFPLDSIVVETSVCKNKDFYEGYYISGFCYHSFKALRETLDTIVVDRNYGIPMDTFPLKTLFKEDIICSEKDGREPSKEQIEEIEKAEIIKI